MIRKLLAAFALLTTSAFAQSVTASAFNQWRANPASGPYSNTNLVAGANTGVSVNPCSYSAGSLQSIPVFAASTPIKIVDPGNPSVDEIVTPTSVSNGGCTATLTTTYAHTSPFYFVSGSCGLQEAINNAGASGVLNSVVLNSAFHASGCGAGTIYLVSVGSPYLTVEDSSIKPAVAYRWNGANYVPSYALFGIADPTAAIGAAAGTGGTIVNGLSSSGNSWTAIVKTGTSTTTGTLFTETLGTAPPSGGNANCVNQSIGANSPPAITLSSALGVVTATVAVAPPASTAYLLNGTCN